MTATGPTKYIVVGVDGSPGSRAALRFAFEESLIRRTPVQVVTTWMRGFPQHGADSGDGWEDELAEARQIQDTEIGLVLAELDERPEFSQVVVNDLSGPTLVDLARDASLLVVGTGRKSTVGHTFLGLASEFCVRHSSVPVVVVPDPTRIDLVRAGDWAGLPARRWA